MKKLKAILLMLLIGVSILGFTRSEFINTPLVSASTSIDRELKGVWVTPFVGDVDVNSTQKFQNNMTEVLDIMEHYGLNALMFHVRTHNNALYPSDLNPKSNYVSNINFNSFDPIGWLIEETHKRGIEFHAWMNPYRVGTGYQVGSLPSSNPQTNPSNLLSNGSATILDPSKEVVRDHIYDTIKEFLGMYPTTDAIHFDDYFYISGVASSSSDETKRGHIDSLISGIKSAINNFNSQNGTFVQFGISPTGIYRNGNGTVSYESNGNPISTGSNTGGQEHYAGYLFADTVKWAVEGWIDYLMPQVYWADNHPVAGFRTVLSWWDKVFKNLNVNLYTGIGVYMADESSNTYGWQTNMNEFKNQLGYIDGYNKVMGYSIFSFIHLKNGYKNSSLKSGQQVRNAYSNSSRRQIKILPEVKSMTPVIPPSITDLNNNFGTLTWSGVNNAKFYYIYSNNNIVGVIGHKAGLNTYQISNYNPSNNYSVKVLSGTNHLSGESSSGETTEYTITYDLNGGNHTGYFNKAGLATAFLTDLYEFIEPVDISLNDFMHSSSNTSDFNGSWYNNTTYRNKIYAANIKTGNNNYFLSSSEYQAKWDSFADMMVDFVITGNPSQDFWSDSYMGKMRMWQYFTNVKPSNAWSDEDMIMMPNDPNYIRLSYNAYTETFTLDIPTKEGYDFGGWYTNSNFTSSTVTTIPTGSSGNKTFYAKWVEISYTITYELNGGSFDFGYSDRDVMIKDFLTDFYDFIAPSGVSLDDFLHGTGKTSGYDGRFKEHISVYGNAKKMYELNDDKLVDASKPNIFIKQEKYNKWVLLLDLIDEYTNKVNSGQNTWNSWSNFVARITPFINQNNYGYPSINPLLNKIPEGLSNNLIIIEAYTLNTSTITLETPKYEGYYFLDWYDNPSFIGSPVITIPAGSSGNKIFYAKWEPVTPLETFTVTFNVDYLGGINPSTQNVYSGSTAYEPINPTREGRVFVGWYLEEELFDFDTLIYSDITLIAKWEILVTGNAVEAIEGASIRLGDGNQEQGLRFYAQLDDDYKNYPHGFYLVYGVITSEELNDLITDSSGTLTYNDKAVFEVSVGGYDQYNEYSVVLTEIPVYGYLTKITVVPYIIVEDKVHLSNSATTRSIYDVAYKGYKTNGSFENIINQVSNNLYRIKTNGNTIEFVESNVYDINREELRNKFISDWNTKFGTNWSSLNAHDFYNSAKTGLTDLIGSNDNLSPSNLYKFFNDPIYGVRWSFVLDAILEQNYEKTHPTRQIIAIRGDGTNGAYDGWSSQGILFHANHLSYTIYNFFNASNETTGYPATAFSEEEVSNYIKVYNDTVISKLDMDYIIKGDYYLIPLTSSGYSYQGTYYPPGTYIQINGEITLTKS